MDKDARKSVNFVMSERVVPILIDSSSLELPSAQIYSMVNIHGKTTSDINIKWSVVSKRFRKYKVQIT